MNKRNFQRELDRFIATLERDHVVPTLLLHSCCAPCSSYCLEYLSQYFKITVYYYNPNIFPDTEYEYRVREQERLIRELNAEGVKHEIKLAVGEFDPQQYYRAVRGLEQEKEGGARCTECFKLRLSEAARAAKELGVDYFTTTLTISRMKNAEHLNQLGEEAGAAYGVKYLNSDFKKKNGENRATELSKEHNLYRQDYCGCVYSKLAKERENARHAEEHPTV